MSSNQRVPHYTSCIYVSFEEVEAYCDELLMRDVCYKVGSLLARNPVA